MANKGKNLTKQQVAEMIARGGADAEKAKRFCRERRIPTPDQRRQRQIALQQLQAKR